MQAHACLAVAAGTARDRISRLRSQAPLVLRPTIPVDNGAGHWAVAAAVHVALATSAAGPVGGDRLRLDVDVGAGATLLVRGVSATLALPGPHGEMSHTDVRIRVAARGTVVWSPRPVIAARRCDHHATTRIELAADARLLAREEVLLGRHGEQPGAVRQRLRVTVAGRAVYDQDLELGAGAPGWRGAAVAGGHRALGTVLVVDPGAGTEPKWPEPAPAAATLSLAGHAVAVSALAEDAVVLRRRLDEQLAVLGVVATAPAPRGYPAGRQVGGGHPGVEGRWTHG